MIIWACLVLLVVLTLTGVFALLALAGTPALGSWEQDGRDDDPPPALAGAYPVPPDAAPPAYVLHEYAPGRFERIIPQTYRECC